MGVHIQQSIVWMAEGGFDVEDESTYPATAAEIAEATQVLLNASVSKSS
jgi:hypothetical protein